MPPPCHFPGWGSKRNSAKTAEFPPQHFFKEEAKAESSAQKRPILLSVDDRQSSAYKNIQQISFRKLKISQTKLIEPRGLAIFVPAVGPC
jgi:hypothetical protein